MLTLRERQYIEEAKAAIQDVSDDRELVQWHDIYCAGDDYLHLHEDGIRELERAYQSKLVWLTGAGA